MQQLTIPIYGKAHRLEVRRGRQESPSAPRLVIVGYQPNETARDILRLCVDSIRKHTPEVHEIWVVDNCSPRDLASWLEDEKDLNVVFNRTAPIPRRRFFLRRMPRPYWASHANAVALEIAAQLVPPETTRFMGLHMDVMACCPGWLGFLLGKFSDRVRGVGVRMDTARVRTLHILGMMFDFSLYRPLHMCFEHDMPRYDVGDGVSIALEKAGYELWACRNTHTDPSLTHLIPESSPYRNLRVDRAFDDKDRVIFMHLGRGVIKSSGADLPGKTTPEEWIAFGRQVVLAQ